MNSDFQIENRIKSLKDISPRQEWVSSLKKNITSRAPVVEPRLSWFEVMRPQYAYAFVSMVLISFGAIWMINSAKGPTVIPFTTRTPEYYLDVAAQKAKQINEVAKKGNSQNLSKAINESALSLKEAAQNIPTAVKSKSEAQTLASKVQDINTALEAARKEAGMQFNAEEQKVLTDKTVECIQNGMNEAQQQLASIISNEIKTLSSTTLSDAQQKLFSQAKLDFAQYQETGEWNMLESAAQKIYSLSNEDKK